MDPFIILPQEKTRYIEQFNSLKPVGGFVSGDQAKGFLLQSQLPPMILGQIWDLADVNSDGKLDLPEFSIACKLINLKLRGFEVPKTLPPGLKSSCGLVTTPTQSGTPTGLIGITPLIPMGGIPPVAVPAKVPVIPPMIPIQPVQSIQQMQPIQPVQSIQPMQPLVQPVMGMSSHNIIPVTAPIQPVVPMNLPPMTANIITPAGLVTPPSQPAGFGHPVSTSSFDGSKPNTPDSSKVLPQRTASVSSKDSPLTDWAVPHQSKLKYTQVFNSHDRGKSGFLSGVQARGILVQTQLPQPMLARIWTLSDIDADGRLSCDEFVLAMHLCDMAKVGDKIPDILPPELLPPTFRRPSLTAAAMAEAFGGSVTSPPPPGDDLKAMSPVTFEDKRKENFEKGQAELDKRRRALAEQQRREQAERERKEREEQERKEKIRQEQERRRLAELEKQMAKQREIEMEKEEQRRKLMEQREAARKEMERQRQLEWQKQRLQELQHQKQKEQEKLALLRANHQRLEVELLTLEDKVLDLSSKIVETRTGVAEAKSTIDGMRTTRDSQMGQLATLKTQLREQNQRLLTVSQEKARLEAKNRMNATGTPNATDATTVQNIAARQLALGQAKEKLELLQEEVNKKMQDFENNNTQLTALKNEQVTLAHLCQGAYDSYLSKRQQVLQLRATGGSNNAWDRAPSWSEPASTSWTTSTSSVEPQSPKAGQSRYRALYEFVARNGDEISFQPGDIILVTESLSNEPGWLSGEVRGHVGWFPEAYVEKIDQAASWSDSGSAGDSSVLSATGALRHPLEGIQELPENVSDSGSIAEAAMAVGHGTDGSAFIPVKGEASSPILGQGEIVDNVKAEALYVWQGKKENHLSFDKGDMILVREQQDMWWFGECNGYSGWFPKSFVSVVQTDEAIPTSPRTPKSGGEELCYVAMYPYDSTEPGDLSFQAGEMVVVSKKDGDWWTGTIGSRTGVFPSNYVQKADLQYEAAADSEVEAATAAAAAASAAASAAATTTASASVSSDSAFGGQTSTRPSTAPIDTDFESNARSVPRAASSASSGAASPSNAQTRGGKKPEIATVIAPYTATSSEQLSLLRGQLIMIRKKSASGWWEGELQAKGRKRQIGWFPASYVKVLSSSGGSSRTTPVPMDSTEDDMLPKIPTATVPTATEINAAIEAQQANTADQVVALFPYTAQNEDELSFLQGDVIHVVDREDPAWWKGELKGQTGLFPSNYVEVMGSLAASAALGAAAASSSAASAVSPVPSQWLPSAAVLAQLSPKEQTRQIAIQELISTEENYMADMSVVTEVFQQPMAQSVILQAEDIDTIFLNWKDLIVCNNTFLRALRIRLKMSTNGIIQTIGDILVDYFPHMSPYIRFCSRQLNAAALIQQRHENVPEFRELLKRCQMHPKVKGMPLTSYLLKPMQRITKYPLLIKKILEGTHNEHPDFQLLEEALHKAEELCTQVNEGVREQENSERLEWLQRRVHIEGLDERLVFNSLTNMLGPRKLIHFGGLKKVKSGKELLTFVFNDFLMFTTPSRPLASLNLQFLFDNKSNLQVKMYRKPIFLNAMRIAAGGSPIGEINGEGEQGSALRFTIQDGDYKMVLSCNNSAERILWIRKLEETCKQCLATERSVMQRQRSKINEGDVCGRLLVMVVEAFNLQSRSPTGKSDPYCEVSIGSQEHRTKVMPSTVNPKWNASMQFLVKDLNQDVLCITVLDRDYFSPNEFLGRTELRLSEIVSETKVYRGPLIKRLPLHEVESGEVILKLDLQIFKHHR